MLTKKYQSREFGCPRRGNPGVQLDSMASRPGPCTALLAQWGKYCTAAHNGARLQLKMCVCGGASVETIDSAASAADILLLTLNGVQGWEEAGSDNSAANINMDWLYRGGTPAQASRQFTFWVELRKYSQCPRMLDCVHQPGPHCSAGRAAGPTVCSLHR